MKIIDVLKKAKKPYISFEIFPPKMGVEIDIHAIVERLSKLQPQFIGVTYGAGGTGVTCDTIEIAAMIRQKYGVESIAHLTCSDATVKSVSEQLVYAKSKGIDNILALRGDKVNHVDSDFKYAVDLIKVIDKSKFCIGAAAYPEGHPEAKNIEEDLYYTKAKVDAGADFLVTQLAFDNAYFYNFLQKARKIGIDVPILFGVMPILSVTQIHKMTAMCGAAIPTEVSKIFYNYKDCPISLKSAGIEYSIGQIRDLIKNGVDGIHIYAMNKPEVAEQIMSSL